MEIVFNKLSYIENKSSSSERKLFDDVNLVIEDSSITGFLCTDYDIIGKLIMAIKRPMSGEIIIDGMIVKRTSHIDNINKLRKKIGFFSMGSDLLFLSDTVEKEIKETIKNYEYRTSNVSKHISDSLKLVGLNDSYLDRNPNELSNVEKKKVKFACLLSYNPNTLVLSDFDKNMSYREKEYFKKLFLKLKNKFHKTIIIITKDLKFMFDLVDKVYVINKGKVVISGGKEIFYDNKLYKYSEMPKIIEFTKCVQSMGHDILEYTDIKELIKEIYRNVK